MPASLRQCLWILALSGMALVSSACVHHVHRHPTRVVTNAPPPWAPAHGHRHVHHDLTLVFDSELDCYTVGGHRDYFFHHDHYYRWRVDRWERSLRVGGPWSVVTLDRLPPGLRGWHARKHVPRLEREKWQAERERMHERQEDERERARLRRAHERARERAQEARRLEREAQERTERARKLEREAEQRAERRREREERREEARRERRREEHRAEAQRQREERKAERRREQQREERQEEAQRQQKERRAEARGEHGDDLSLRERRREALESRRERRPGGRKPKVVEPGPEPKAEKPGGEDEHERRRASKRRGIRSDASDVPAHRDGAED